jgi:hypothetical protein
MKSLLGLATGVTVCLVAGLLLVLPFNGINLSGDARASETGRYIVQFRDDVADVDATIAGLQTRHEFTVMVVYYHAIKGFAGDMTSTTADALAGEPVVLLVQRDSIVETANGWGDVNCDGAVNSVDALDLLRYIAAMPFRDGIGCRAGDGFGTTD